MTYKNLPQHDLTAQLYLKLLLLHNTKYSDKKGQMSEQRRQMYKCRQPCRLVIPILVILHIVKFGEVLRQEAHGSYRSIRQSYRKKYFNHYTFIFL